MPDNNNWRGKGYSFFQNTRCEMFPCHETCDTENFNCLFCYCPLYALDRDCGGNFTILSNGIKDCSACLLPHKRDNYGYVTGRCKDITEIMKRHGKINTVKTIRPS